MSAIEDDLTRALVIEHATCHPEFIDGLWLWSCDGVPVVQSDWDRGAHLAAVLAPLLEQAREQGARQALTDAAAAAFRDNDMDAGEWLSDRAATYTTTKENDHG